MKLENPIHLEEIITQAIINNKELRDALTAKIGEALLRIDFVPLVESSFKEAIEDAFSGFAISDELEQLVNDKVEEFVKTNFGRTK